MSIAERLLNGGRLRSETPAAPSPDDDYWYQALDSISAGGSVSADAAMRVSAVYACVTVITEDVASLALELMRRIGRGRKELADDVPLSDVLRLQPNTLQTSFEWREMCQGHVLLRGNAYNVIVPNDRGAIGELVPLHPDCVTVTVLPSRVRVYEYKDPSGKEQPHKFLDDEIFHLVGRESNGVKGKGVIESARESIALARSSQRSANKLYDQGMKAPGVLQHPGVLSDEAYNRIREDFAQKNLGVGNWHKPILLEDGMTWQSLGMTSQDAQFVETYKGSLEDIARFFRMPPHKIGLMDRATFSNIEHQGIDYVIGCLRAWLVRWQMRIDTDLIVPSTPPLFAEFDDTPLLRGDMKSRYEAHAIGRQWGWENADEIRADFGRNPTEDGAGGDYWRPMNMARSSDPTPAQLAASRSSSAGASARAALYAETLAVSLVRRELDRVAAAAERHASDGEGWASFLADFYGEHAERIARTLRIPDEAASAYTDRQVRELKSAGVVCMEEWLAERPRELVQLAMAA